MPGALILGPLLFLIFVEKLLVNINSNNFWEIQYDDDAYFIGGLGERFTFVG